MNIEHHLAIRNYAMQRVYMTRILEMVCALQEQNETKQDPTGLLFSIIRKETDETVQSLVDELMGSQPDDAVMNLIHGIPDETIDEWLDGATSRIMAYNEEWADEDDDDDDDND